MVPRPRSTQAQVNHAERLGVGGRSPLRGAARGTSEGPATLRVGAGESFWGRNETTSAPIADRATKLDLPSEPARFCTRAAL